MTTVGIVCGYDLNDELAAYVGSIRPLIERERLDYIVLSGGRTSPRSFSSEAWVMARALGEILPAGRVLLEEHAMTTLENLVFGRGLAEHHCGAVDRFVVFCDRVHRRKVSTLARLLLGARATVHWVHHDVSLRVRLLEPLSHLIEAAVALVPPLRRHFRALSIRLKGVSGAPPRSARPAAVSSDAPRRRRTRTSAGEDQPLLPERSQQS